MHGFASVAPEWEGEVGYIVAGGPSVTQGDVDRLKGRKVLVINTSYEKAPWADFLFYGDKMWWTNNGKKVRETFAGRIVTVRMHNDWQSAPNDALVLLKVPDRGLATERHALTMHRTSLQASINLLVHLGVKRIVLLGVDMQAAKDGRTHHHSPYPRKKHRRDNWQRDCWRLQMQDLKTTVKPLARLGVEVVNTSMDSLIDWWPKRPLAEVLDG